MLAAEDIPADVLIELLRSGLAVARNERLEDEVRDIRNHTGLDHRGGRIGARRGILEQLSNATG